MMRVRAASDPARRHLYAPRTEPRSEQRGKINIEPVRGIFIIAIVTTVIAWKGFEGRQ